MALASYERTLVAAQTPLDQLIATLAFHLDPFPLETHDRPVGSVRRNHEPLTTTPQGPNDDGRPLLRVLLADGHPTVNIVSVTREEGMLGYLHPHVTGAILAAARRTTEPGKRK